MAILGQAQHYQHHLVALMMDQATVDAHLVTEPESCLYQPLGLNTEQTHLFTHLKTHSLRLEQELLDKNWAKAYCRQAGLCAAARAHGAV